MAIDLFTIAHQYRIKLLNRDAQASASMVRLYALAAQRIEAHAFALATKMDEAITRGERVSPSWLFQQERMQRLLIQVQNEMATFADAAAAHVAGTQREFAFAGATDTQDLVTITRDNVRKMAGVASQPGSVAALGVGFAKLPAEAAIDLVGFASDGSPLADLFAQLGPAAAETIKQEMFAGLVAGLGARQLAAKIRPALAGNMARAMLIGRTEALRAYRESSQRFFQENDDVVVGWRWVAACNARTCPVCWALHGTLHMVDEQFVSHPGCRCTPAPVTTLSPGMATGGARFSTLSEDDQRQVLGPKKFDAYQNGKITLGSLAGMKDSGRWGKTRYERNLADAIEATRNNRPVDHGPMRRRPFDGAPTPAPAPHDEPLEVLLPIVETQLPATSGSEARQRVIDLGKQYEGMLGAIDDELKNIRQIRNFMHTPETRDRALELGQLRQRVVEARNEHALEILSTPQPAEFAVNIKSRVPAERKRIWQQGVETFKRLVGVDLQGKTINVRARGRGRAHYDLKGSIHIAPGDAAPVIVHELGHWLEHMSAQVHRKVVDFLERRTAGEKTVNLRAVTGLPYARHEIALRDKFADPYVGKIYRKQFVQATDTKYDALYASEVVSMGLQWYVEKPAEFAAEDPDFFDFIFDLVRGR